MMKTLNLILTFLIIFFSNLMDIPELYEIQKQFVKDCSSVIENGQIGIFSSPTGTGKTLSLLLSVKNFIMEREEEEEKFLEDFLGRPVIRQKIYYCSRTHSQLKQVVNEFKKLCISTNSVVLGSRKVYCINKDVINKQASVEAINSKCRDLVSDGKCIYYVEHYKEKGIFSIEDLIKDSVDHKYCPYYFSKEYFKKADVVFLPYNLLFNEESRSSLGINLNDAIIIVDEAHNIIESVTQMNSGIIKSDDTKRYILAINKYKKILKSKSNVVDLVVNILNRLMGFFENQQTEEVLEVSDFLFRTKLHNVNTLELTENIKNSRLIFKLESYEKNLNLKLQDISKFLNLLVASDSSSRVQCNSKFLKIFPLSTEVFFQQFKPVKSIIFAGGTMEPIDELKGVFGYREVINYSYNSDERKFKAYLVDKIGNKEIIVKQSTREDLEMFSQLKEMIISLVEDVPQGGTVVFLPSKYYLDVFRNLFSDTNCFFEGVNKFEEYVLKVRRSKSILFAVIGGTFSEGVNFSDDLCRLLILIGIPYPTIDTEMNERLKYSGFDWYTQTAMKKVNQTIGRAIRHKEDYAAIVLIDKRYKNLRKYLSPWILNNLEVTSLDSVKLKTKKFLSDNY